MMSRLNMTYNDLMAVRHKYNGILNDLLAQRKNHYILDYNKEVLHPINFLPNNQLNVTGKEDLWNVIDRKMEIFDFNKNTLLPKTAEPEQQN